MKRLLSFWVLAATAFIAGCGGSGDNTIIGGGNNNTVTGSTSPATITLLASSTQILTDQQGNQAVTLTARVQDTNNIVVENAVVTFSASSGSLQVPTTTTDVNGIVTASLSTTNPANGTITVSASAIGDGGNVITDTLVIAVSGTGLIITGPASLAQGQQGTFTVSLRDGQSSGISGQLISIASALGNTLSAGSLLTDGGGQIQFNVTATQAGVDTLTISGLGLVSTFQFTVSDDSFTITTPLTNAEVSLGVLEPVSILWEKAGVPQVGETINFFSTRGTLSASSAVTNGAGVASVNLSSTNSGPAVITAVNDESTVATASIEFVAVTPDTLVVQADPFTVTTGQTSSISAVVRDPSGNLVKNQVVVFELTDTTGGSLSVASDTTDSQGVARTTYTAGTTSSAQDAVSIRAFVQSAPAVEDTALLTVADEDLFIVIGTGNDIFEPSLSLFANEWSVIASDVDGNPSANKNIQVSVLSEVYYKGTLVLNGAGDAWIRDPAAVACQDEDTLVPGPTARNGILDPGEDFNGSGRIEAGNVSSVVPFPATGDCSNVAGGAAQTNVTTDGAGIARVCVVYPQDHNLWVEVEIEAEASVSGTEFATAQQFLLPGKAEDFTNVNASPPGLVSPFGPDLNCAIPPP